MIETAYRYDPACRRFIETDALAAPTIIDSWLAVDGRVRAIGRHFDRFSSSIDGYVNREHVQGFLDCVAAEIPREGAWFPRIEYAETSGLALRLRPAPNRDREAVLWDAPQTDPRHTPHAKGPDLAALTRVRARAHQAGAHEAVIIGRDGVVCETTFATLMWWEDDVLCGPDWTEPVLPSVTRALVETIARNRGIDVDYRPRSWEHVRYRPMWLLNALHGVRAVSAIAGGQAVVPVPQTSATLLESFRRDLDTYAEPAAQYRATGTHDQCDPQT
ncbi:MAG TPA: aminotransferase class IV [Candidatus Stackebrandtia faecavium]|nr:aminotransferase class IV [Candidatus Stackebrandtia faecavium]